MSDSALWARVCRGFGGSGVEVDGADWHRRPVGASMDADLDLLLTTVFVTADDLLPERQNNAARRVTDAEVVTLCVAQAIMGIPSDRRFLAVARKRLGHLFPELPQQPGYFKRRRRCADTLEWLLGVFASHSPGFGDDLLLVDSTPIACAQSRQTVRRSARRDEPGRGPHLAPIRQRIESIIWTLKDVLTLERHGARTLAGLRERILQRLLCLTAAIALNHQLVRPSRALVNYCA